MLQRRGLRPRSSSLPGLPSPEPNGWIGQELNIKNISGISCVVSFLVAYNLLIKCISYFYLIDLILFVLLFVQHSLFNLILMVLYIPSKHWLFSFNRCHLRIEEKYSRIYAFSSNSAESFLHINNKWTR